MSSKWTTKRVWRQLGGGHQYTDEFDAVVKGERDAIALFKNSTSLATGLLGMTSCRGQIARFVGKQHFEALERVVKAAAEMLEQKKFTGGYFFHLDSSHPERVSLFPKVQASILDEATNPGKPGEKRRGP
jgi:hypothetical protein